MEKLEIEMSTGDVTKSQMESCPHCSRTFFQGRLNLHLKSCKANKPMKKVAAKNLQPKQSR